MIEKRAIVLLAAYDASALYLTLKTLDHTLSNEETVVIILNGKRGIRSAFVEDVAREWIQGNKNRFVVRPLNYGNDPYNSIKEIIKDFEPLKHKEFICKIDDDLIPLRKGWLDNLHSKYLKHEEKSKIGFITSLINNNAWGFSELIKIFNKEDEYRKIMNYPSISGEGIVMASEIANGVNGTVWQYPYLAKWCHEWTLLDIDNYLDKTKNLIDQEIPLKTHYSIGCIFFRKQLWLDVAEINKVVNFDELAIHMYCKQNSLKKIAVMSEPMGHLYYFVQRKANATMFPLFVNSLSEYWNDETFALYPKYENETLLSMHFEEFSMSSVFQNFSGKPSLLNRLIRFIFRKTL
ncbi:MAG: hypothetical protein ACN6NU_01815 [Acinetobacter sp.]